MTVLWDSCFDRIRLDKQDYMEDTIMYYMEPKTLIVVYKDELLVNQLKKLIETKDDGDENAVVGTTDGSVQIVAWTEKVWLEQKKTGHITSEIETSLSGIRKYHRKSSVPGRHQGNR